jgi:hypothetical protein
MAAANARAARVSGALFAVFGALAVLVGVGSVLLGVPAVAHDLVPVAGLGDATARLGQTAPVLSSGIAALMALVIAALLAGERLAAPAAALELLVLGLAIEICVGGAVGRIGHATDGGVLVATVVCLMGGVSVAAGGVVAALGRE